MSNVTALKPTARELLAGIKIIDVDTHISEWPELWTERAPGNLKARVPRIVGEPGDRRWVIDEDTFLAPGCASKYWMPSGASPQSPQGGSPTSFGSDFASISF